MNSQYVYIAAILLLANYSPQAFSLIARNIANGTCNGLCGTAMIPGDPCQCNTACANFGDCCADYNELCVRTCDQKCEEPVVPGAICQCNRGCRNRKDCCSDYENSCGVTDDDMHALTEELLTLDINNAAKYVELDIISNPLFKFVDPEAYEIPTIAKLVSFFDNYIPDVHQMEFVTPEEIREEYDFVDAVFATPVMKRAQEFLMENDLPNGRKHFERIWFGQYNRGLGRLGSSGFEHVFLGELWNGISGFHNWLYYAHEEANGNLVNGTVAKLLDFGKGWVIENGFSWLNQSKPIGGGFIGTSPEFDLAIYTVCWNARPNGNCPISLNGHNLDILTYDTTPTHSNVTTYVSTSYTVLP